MKIINIKIKFFIFFLFFLIFPFFVFAENKTDIIFKAQVDEILKEQNTTLPDGKTVKQQNIKLKGLEGEFADKFYIFEGIGDFDVIKKNIYKKGDKVLVLKSLNAEGNAQYYITDYDRSTQIIYLSLIFLFVLFAVGGIKGVRSVFALIATFFVVIEFIIPKILNGANPLFITILGSFVILLLIIYLTEGLTKHAHIAVISIFLSLSITVFLSWFFVSVAKLSGLSGEETGMLVSLGDKILNFKGLLLAGIIIGALGVLDDVVISQVVSVEQIFKTNKELGIKELFSRAYKIGVSHISSMTNTLFLAYAGASLPLLILFSSGNSAFNTWSQLIGNEQIATEIIRTLAGSIGLILSVPISTILATYWFKKRV